MASHILTSVADRWPVGTTVGAYALDGLGNRTGSAVTTGNVQADGSLAFTGLAAGTRYQAFANSTGVFFQPQEDAATSGEGVVAQQVFVQATAPPVSYDAIWIQTDAGTGLPTGDVFTQDGSGPFVPGVDGAVPTSLFTEKGAIIVGTGADVPATVDPPDTDGYLLTSDSDEESGVKWAPPVAVPSTGAVIWTADAPVSGDGNDGDTAIVSSLHRIYGPKANGSWPISYQTLVVPTGDTTKPTTPGQPAATVSTGQIALTWTASTDAVGVTGYNVYRDGVFLDDAVTNAFTDTTVAFGTEYSYTVRAFDAAGNFSDPSTARVVTSEGVGGSFTLPTDQLLMYLTADSITGKSDGDHLTVDWPDASGIGNAMLLTGTIKPQYKTGGPNSKPYVRFVAADSNAMQRSHVSQSFTLGANSTAIMVCRFHAIPAATTLLAMTTTNATSTARKQLIVSSASPPKWQARGDTVVDSGVTAVADTWVVVGARFGGNTAGSGPSGVRVGATSVLASIGTSTQGGVKIGANQAGTTFYDIDIAFLALWNKTLSDTEWNDAFGDCGETFSLTV